MEDRSQIPSCPKCGRSDCVTGIFELAEQQNTLALRLSPPEKPSFNRPLVSLSEGLGCLGALFFGSALFLAVTYGSIVAAIIFGLFVLLFSASFLLTILRGLRERRELDQRLFAWQQEMELWERQYYCSRDDLIFDPETGRTTAPAPLNVKLN